MGLSHALQKAALLMDLKGDARGAEATLEHALAEAGAATPDRLRAQVFLAELLLRDRPDEALALLAQVVGTPIPESWDDEVADDLAHARDLLSKDGAK